MIFVHRLSLKRKRGTESKEEASDESEAEEEEEDHETAGDKDEKAEEVRNPQKAKKFVADKKKAKKRKVSRKGEEAESKKPKEAKSKKPKNDTDTQDASSSVVGEVKSGDVLSEKSPTNEKKQKKKKKDKSKPSKPDDTQIVSAPVISTTKASSPKKKNLAKTPKGEEEKQPKKGIDGYSAPKISSEATPPTPVFVRKALSKQKQKKGKVVRETPQDGASSTPTTPSKRLNFAMSCNKFQTVLEHSRDGLQLISHVKVICRLRSPTQNARHFI